MSRLEGKDKARKLGYIFFEVLVKDSRNFKETFYTIVRQLQKLSVISIKVLNNLIDLLPEIPLD